MIESDTAFVLGAGASIPYDFPSGRNLLLETCQNIERDNDTWKNIFEALGIGWDEVKNFATALRRSHLPSIDRFFGTKYRVHGNRKNMYSTMPNTERTLKSVDEKGCR